MTELRHPDIEIYIKNRTVAQIREWLSAQSQNLSELSQQGLIHELQVDFPSASATVMVHEKVAGKAWTSVWFKVNPTPWDKDLDCAINAAQALQTQVRCIASGWSEGDDPDEYWKIENGAQEKVQWLS